MQERTLRLGLLALAAASIGLSLWVYLAYVPVVQSVAAPFLTPIFCANSTGTYVLAGPTTASLCSTLSQSTRNLDAALCDVYPSGQQDACKELFAALGARQADCLGYVFTNQTQYAGGYPAVAAACRKLTQ